MRTDTVTLFFALLAVVAQAAVVAGVVLAVGRRFSPAMDRWAADVAAVVGPSALLLAFGVATVCTFGSLYLSEVANFTPCNLCWYQRIAMYPLVPILGLAAWRRHEAIRPYGAVLAGTGALIASYHVLVERFPSLESSVCDPVSPCTLIWTNRFGYLTIPTMALSGFALILLLLAVREPTNLEDN